ncbi:MAG: hypothetical protein KC503_42075 [Myxococcales bacterium]|nr:hypothetical protein [Myxococcales bacterium]
MRDIRLHIAAVAMLSAIIAVACGGRAIDGAPEGPVPAINLTSGEIKTYPDGNKIPAGWAACKDPSCSGVLPGIPCVNLGPDVCTKNPSCKVEEFNCQGSGVACAPDQPCPPPPPPTCDKRCVPDQPTCDDHKDSKTCSADSKCQWAEAPCLPPPCEPNKPCPPVSCPGSCTNKAPPSCESLGEKDCQARSTECVWDVRPCLFWCAADDPSCQCGPFCRTRKQNCPTLAPPPPDFCPDGRIVTKYDSNGCVTGFSCEKEQCPPLGLPYPACNPGEVVVEVKDKNGCITSYRCEPKCPAIPLPGPPTCLPGEKLKEKKDASGCLIGWECVKDQCPPPPPIAPCPPDRVFVPEYDSNGCLIGGRCESVNKVECDKLAKDYQSALTQAKQCNPLSMSPVLQCAQQVDNALACGCPTLVNNTNIQAVAQLAALKKKWDSLQCGIGIVCPAMPCWLPQGATCTGAPGSTAGSCVDNTP